MSTSNTLTKTDLANILNEIVAIDGTDMTSQEIGDFVDSLNITEIHAVDYIVEQGKSGDWSYRKWNSGKIEAWGKYIDSNGQVGSKWVSAFDYLYYYDKAVSFPTGLFDYAPRVYVSSSSSQWTGYSTYSVSASGFTIRMTKPGASSQPIGMNIYAIYEA